jgi:hypothetical protein
MNEFFQMILGFLNQNCELKFFNFAFVKADVPVCGGNVHLFDTGNFISILNQQVKWIEGRNQIKMNHLFFVYFESKNKLLLLIVHQVRKWNSLFQINIFVVLINSC